MNKCSTTFSLIISLFIIGCAHTYDGPLPDLNLQGEAAQEEIKNFELSSPTLADNTQALNMGPNKDLYFLKSIKPVIQKVSPKANQRIDEINSFHKWTPLLLLISLGVLVTELTDGDDNYFSSSQYYAFYGPMVLGLGFDIYANHQQSKAIEIYNNDLKRQLSPKVSYSWSY